MTPRTLLAATLLLTAGVLPHVAHADTACTMPFQRGGTLPLPAYYAGTTASIAVPAGYRLHLEYVGATVTIVSGGRPAFSVSTTAGGYSANYPLPVQTGYNLLDRQASQAVSLYADPGTTVSVRIYRGSATTASSASYSVSGCLHPL